LYGRRDRIWVTRSASDRGGSVQRPADVRNEVVAVLAAGAEAYVAGPIASPPQRARRSALEWTPPKLVASAISSDAPRKAWARSAVASSNPITVPKRFICRRGLLVGRVGRQSRVADEVHVVARQKELGERERVRATALQTDVESRERAVRQPDLERPRDRAGFDPPGVQFCR